MVQRIILSVFLIGLAVLFWYSPTTKELAAGVAIVLFGMISLEQGFKRFTEGPLKKVIKNSTRTFAQSLGIGVFFTALLQSSSLISIIVISFISAGLIGLKQGIAVILGSNIGTTATGWLVALLGLKLHIDALAFPMLAFGIILVLQKSKLIRGFGGVLAGLGFFFLGIQLMKNGFESFDFQLALDTGTTGYWREAIFIGIGIGLTVLLQSSSASLALTLTALAAGSITFLDSLSLVIGANMGTTVTAVLGAAAANEAGRRLAGAHLAFNLGTGLLAFLLLPQLQLAVEWASGWLNIGATEYTLKLALFHTVFNVLGVIVFAPLTGRLEKILMKIIPAEQAMEVDKARYLNKAALMHPQAATEALIKETHHLIDNGYVVLAHALNLKVEDILSKRDLRNVVAESNQVIQVDVDTIYKNSIKKIYGKILKYATIAATLEKETEEEISIFHQIKLANRHLVEAVKNTKDIKGNMSKYLKSPNEYMRNEYDEFRFRLAVVMREVHSSVHADDPEPHLEKLTRYRKKLKKHDVVKSGTLDRLIRDQLIDTRMASSLMNDSSFVSGIGKDLIKTGELLGRNGELEEEEEVQELEGAENKPEAEEAPAMH